MSHLVFAVISLTVLLLTVALAARRSRPVAHSAQNVVSLDAYRAARRRGEGAAPAAVASMSPEFQYPLTAAGGGLSTAPTGGLRTCRQPDGRLGRPSARTEPV